MLFGDAHSFVVTPGQTSRSRSLGQKSWYSIEGLCTRNVKLNIKTQSLLVKLWTRLKLIKSRSNFKVKVTTSTFWYPWISLVTRNAYVKYESYIYRSSWVIGKVKDFVHTNTQGDTDTGGTTIALWTFVWTAKNATKHLCPLLWLV